MEKVSSCPVCNSTSLTRLGDHTYEFPGDDVKNNLISKKYVRRWILFKHILKTDDKSTVFHVDMCSDCGFIFSNPRFTTEEMELKYKLIDELGSVKARVSNYPEKYRDMRAKRIFDLVDGCRGDLGLTGSARVLDYGGQGGVNLKYFDENGYACEVIDYEEWPMPGNVKYAGRTLNDVQGNPEIVLCNHTLEHVVDPVDFVSGIANVMNNASLLYIEVPLGAFYREYQRVMDIEPLTHVNFFSEQSLKEVCDRAGLNTHYLKTEYQQLQTVKYWCINIVVGKAPARKSVKPRSTSSQLGKKWVYFGEMAVDRLMNRARKAVGMS